MIEITTSLWDFSYCYLRRRNDPLVMSQLEIPVQNKDEKTDRELSDADLEIVCGGINPQPLPPCHPPEERPL